MHWTQWHEGVVRGSVEGEMIHSATVVFYPKTNCVVDNSSVQSLRHHTRSRIEWLTTSTKMLSELIPRFIAVVRTSFKCRSGDKDGALGLLKIELD